MTQLGLFGDRAGELIRNPLCIYIPNCGRMAILGPPEDREGCVNRTITAVNCQCHGEMSTRTDAA